MTTHDLSAVYPAGPADVPEGLTEPSPAYKRHAWLTFAALMGFVALYLGLTAFLGRTVYTMVSAALTTNTDAVAAWALSIAPAFLLIFLLRGLFLIKRGSTGDLLEITEEDEPLLFAFVHRVADEAGAPRPHRVFLSPRVNAAVFYDLSFRNFVLPTKKNLEIGLGLVNTLTLDELKAVIAHEFGHFAQRTMAVGRWVYLAQQIAGHIVASRGKLDTFLSGLSRSDLRVAWIGWGMRLLVWAIRSVLDVAFRAILLADRALSREMEYQADLVAVSLTGSDSLVHGLHRLDAADDAWHTAADVLGRELDDGRRVRDFFAIQSAVINLRRDVFDDQTLGATPSLPDGPRSEHRVFDAAVARVPEMWSTHPPNRAREDNAKTAYLPSTLDERSGWALFKDADATRAQATKELIDRITRGEGGEQPEFELPDEEPWKKRLQDQADRRSCSSRFHGCYLGRSVTLGAERVGDLVGKTADDAAAAKGQIEALYPSSLREDLDRLDAIEDEVRQLEGLEDGALTAPGGIIQHRGEPVQRAQLADLVDSVKAERRGAQEQLQQHDRACRTAHRAAAKLAGADWEKRHAGLLALLHYAEHHRADLIDAQGAMQNVLHVVTADGHVSKKERTRLVNAAHDVWAVMDRMWSQRKDVVLDAVVAKELEVDVWAEGLADEWGLNAPSADNLGDWLDVSPGWMGAFLGPLSALARESLEELLALEDAVAKALDGEALGEAARAGAVPTNYPTRCPGTERERQKKLGLWDRFVTAEGWFAGTLRSAVALAVLLPAMFFVTQAEVGYRLHVVNGLEIPVIVSAGGDVQQVDAGGTALLQPEASEFPVRTMRASDGAFIEEVRGELGGSSNETIYNVAGATVLIRWTASYGERAERPPEAQGAPRWLELGVDYVFQEPPESISSSGDGGYRSALEHWSEQEPWRQARTIEDSEQALAMALAHVRWDPTTSPNYGQWVGLVDGTDEFASVVGGRSEEAPRDVVLGRMAQDYLDREAACARHRTLAEKHADDPDLLYLATRCIEDDADQNAAYEAAIAAHPSHPWIGWAVAWQKAKDGEFQAARDLVEPIVRTPPSEAHRRALFAARLRRLLAAEGAKTSFGDLVAVAPHLGTMLEIEAGASVEAGGWYAMEAGEPDQATGGGDEDPWIVRQAAASSGASKELIERAMAMPVDEALNGDTIWPTLGLAARTGRDPAPYLKAVGLDEPPAHMEALFGLLDVEALRKDPTLVEAALKNQPLETKARGYVLAAVALGDDAPQLWRDRAMALLFPTERPWFR